jgi:hypothetical protein
MKRLRKFLLEQLNTKLTRELWVSTYVHYINEGMDKDYCKEMANVAVNAYNEKFIKVKIKLN